MDGLADGAEFLVATDARRREVYWARYRRDGRTATRIEGPGVAVPDAVRRDGVPVVGRGAELYPGPLGPALAPLEPDAADLAAVAARALSGGPGTSPFLPVEPLYLRRPDATEPGARKRVLGRAPG